MDAQRKYEHHRLLQGELQQSACSEQSRRAEATFRPSQLVFFVYERIEDIARGGRGEDGGKKQKVL